MFSRHKSSFGLGFLGLPLEAILKVCAGVFRKFISENTFIPVFGNELPNCTRSSFFFFSFVSHINRFRLFTGTCQATNQHASDRGESPRLRRLDASGRRCSWRRPRDGGRPGTPCASSRGRGRGYIWF